MENHAVDIPWWGDMVSGPSKPIVDRGFITVPDTPGLGIELNEPVVKDRQGAHPQGRIFPADAAV
jgi:L-alanine-DL-glutamate epimerase-like enolase superfamily enzyme